MLVGLPIDTTDTMRHKIRSIRLLPLEGIAVLLSKLAQVTERTGSDVGSPTSFESVQRNRIDSEC
jgi:hypothetical protein